MTTMLEPMRDDRAAIDKAFSLLNAFGAQGSTGLGVSELARRSMLSKSTAFRVLGMLERNGMVERVGTKYLLGAVLHDLGRAAYAPQQDWLRDLLMPFLTELFDATKHTVHLGVLRGTDVVYLAKLHGHRTAATPSRIGGRLPAHCTGIGKVLLAYDPEAAAAAVQAPLHRLTDHSICEPARLTTDLAEIRREGIAVDHEESQQGVTCVAAPVTGRNGTALAAMSISTRNGSDLRALTATLRRVCASASQAARFAAARTA